MTRHKNKLYFEYEERKLIRLYKLYEKRRN